MDINTRAGAGLPRPLIGCSTKSFLTTDGWLHWVQAIRNGLASRVGSAEDVFACVPFPLLAETRSVLQSLGVRVGAQDVSAFSPGAYTGEVSAELLAGLGCKLVMVGHPERATHLGETGEVFAAKAGAAANAGMVPILIVGEPERGADPEPVIRPQLDVAFARVASDAPVMVAYEPTWAIGQATPAPPAHVVSVVRRIRAILAERDGESRILYGGSAGSGTFASIAARGREVGAVDGIPDGVFLGRASLDPEVFLSIVDEVRATVV